MLVYLQDARSQLAVRLIQGPLRGWARFAFRRKLGLCYIMLTISVKLIRFP